MNIEVFNVIRNIYPGVSTMDDVMNAALDWSLISSSALLATWMIIDNEELPWDGDVLYYNPSIDTEALFANMTEREDDGIDVPMWMYALEDQVLHQIDEEFDNRMQEEDIVFSPAVFVPDAVEAG